MASSVITLVTLLFGLTLVLGQGLVKGEPRRPPNYHHDHMPATSFTCTGKVVGGYYADPDADCQMFHVCVQVDEHDVRDFKFMCPDDTVFDQENFICANWFEIDCQSSTLFYDKNLQLFQPNPKDETNSTAVQEEPSEQERRQQAQQVQQLQVLEEQHQKQVAKQQQVLDQHEKRQQEHQRQQLLIVQDQQRQLEQQQRPEGRKISSALTSSTSATTSTPTPSSTTTTTTTTSGDSGTAEYDYYYYDYDDGAEQQGHFYLNDEYDPKAPGRIVDPSGRPQPPALALPVAAAAAAAVKYGPARPATKN